VRFTPRLAGVGKLKFELGTPKNLFHTDKISLIYCKFVAERLHFPVFVFYSDGFYHIIDILFAAFPKPKYAIFG